MRNSRRYLSQLIISLFACAFLSLSAVSAQDEGRPPPRLEPSGADADQFPVVSLTVISTDASSNRIPLPADFSISEDGNPVSNIEQASDTVGVDFIFVIDANNNIKSRDDSSGLTRQEKVRDSIVSYAMQFMNPNQLDRVSIVVPDGDQVRFLIEDAIFPNEVINEINFYEPPSLGPTPMNEMMLEALDKAEDLKAEGRFQAILLFSDAGPLGQQLDYDSLVARAQELNVPIFGAILGAAADANELNNIERLSKPTRGTFVHMPQSELTDPIYAAVQQNSDQHLLTYRSTINSSGSHIVVLESGSGGGAIEFNTEVLSPGVEMAIDNSAPIVRVADAADAPLDSAEPISQPVAVRVYWPDGRPRELVSAALQVDGSAEAAIPDPELGDDGFLAFEWDISSLGDGTYELVVSVADELGLEGSTEALPVSISVEYPETIQPTLPVPEASPGEEPDTGEESSANLTDNVGTLGIIIGLLAMVFAVALVIFAIVLVRRRQTPIQPAAAQTASASVSGSADDHDATQVIVPAFAAKKIAGAFLEPIDNAPDHQGNIPLSGNNVAIGRDPKLVQIIFNDKSVSRLHARIIQKGSGYQLYDEGSASGTYLNYEQLSLEPQPLRENDDVHIGRVHLRFHLSEAVGDEDATQVMQAPPARQPGAARPAAAAPPVDEDTSTQPYMPHSPQGPSQPQAPAGSDDEDADDISTQPYMPHSPKR